MARMKDYFYSFIQDRLENIRLDIALNNRTYKDYFKEAANLKQEILVNLHEEKKHLLIDFESADSILEAFTQEEIYRTAFLDGIKVCKTFHKVKCEKFDGADGSCQDGQTRFKDFNL